MKKLIVLLFMVLATTMSFARTYEVGFERQLELGYQGEFGKPTARFFNNTVDGVHLNFTYGYRPLERLFVGLGVGADFSFWQDDFEFFGIKNYYAFSMPIYARIKLNLMDNFISPFISADLGYNILMSTTEDRIFEHLTKEDSYKQSGFIAIPSIGVDYNLNDEMALYLSLGYHFHAKPKNELYAVLNNVSSIVAKIGFKF